MSTATLGFLTLPDTRDLALTQLRAAWPAVAVALAVFVRVLALLAGSMALATVLWLTLAGPGFLADQPGGVHPRVALRR